MKQNKLLERQLKKLLPAEMVNHPGLAELVKAINESYNAYERDAELAERAFKISEEDYIEINAQLKKEVDLKKMSINKLKESIDIVQEQKNQSGGDTDSLLDVVNYLNLQIGKRKDAESLLTSTAYRLSALIRNMHTAIMAEDENRKIILTNQPFCDMFAIPAAPEALTGADCSQSAAQSKHLFKDPAAFVSRIEELLLNKKMASGDELELKDGRTLLRDYVPIYVDNNYQGHLWNYTDITYRRKAEKELAASEVKNRLIMNAAMDAIITITDEGQISYWNPQAKKIFGWTEKEIAGKQLTETIIPSSFRDIHEKGMRIYKSRGKGPVLNKLLELTAITKEGTALPIELFIVPIVQDAKTFFCVFIRDITERKKAETSLKQASLVASANKNGVVLTDKSGAITWANEGFTTLTGYTQANTRGRTPVDLLKGALTGAEGMKNMLTNFFNGKNFDVEILCYKKDGTTFWAIVKGQAVLDSEKNVQQYFAIVEDITAAKEAKEKLKEVESRFRIAFEKIGDNVWEHDYETGITFFSKSDSAFLSEDSGTESTVAERWWNSVHKEDICLLEENDRKYKNGTIDTHSLEYRLVHKNGSIRWVLDRGVVIEKTKDGLPQKIIGTHTDITERKKSEQALRINEEKYRGIIANMNLGLLEVDNNEVIQFANQSFCDISGYPLHELLGRKASTLFAKGENLEQMEIKNSIRKKGVSDAYEIAVKNKRGELKWWLISGAPRYNDEGTLVGSIGIHLDITDQKQLELDLIEARENAEESSRAKETFLANMSHEIRTPMNAILGMGRQLQKTALDEKQYFYLDTMQKAGEHLLIIINDILDISKIEAGLLLLENINFSLKDEVNRAVQVMAHRAEEKGLRLWFDIDPAIPSLLLGDPYRLKQILLNLISNSIKFTEKGEVGIRCMLWPGNGSQQMIRIEVSDTGIGIDAAFLKNIFKKFLQEDKTITRKYGGTGLGMSISKQLTELMNGTIEVLSEKEKGTTIILHLPFETGTAEAGHEKEEMIFDAAMLAGKKILLVEDNEMNRLVATTVLNHYGVVVTEVFDGKAALEELPRHNYCLVLMDMQMPVMDGLEATINIRSTINKTIPIIALTANAIKGETKRCLDAGMNDYVSKPFEEEDLIKKICYWLTKETTGQLIVTPAAVTALYNLSALEEIGRGNKDFVSKMLNLFILQAPLSVQEIKKAFAANDREQLKKVAHRFKPSIDNLNIISIKREIREIEALATGTNRSAELEPLISKVEQVIMQVVEQLKAL
jgi:PAS domain S-box-containing protein